MLTIRQAANRLGVHPTTLRRWVDLGLIRAARLPSGYRRFDPREVERFRTELGIEGDTDRHDRRTEEDEP